MASKSYRPGRKLLVFFGGVALLFALVASLGNWKPQLGLDLQGGTRITLIALGDPTGESLDQARQIIDQRVNGSGIAEADVTTQGGRFIVVEIPGESRRDLIETVKRQAQLRFRVVAEPSSAVPNVAPETTPETVPETEAPSPGDSPPGSPAPRVAPNVDRAADPTPTPTPTSALSDAPAATPGATPAATPSGTETAAPATLPAACVAAQEATELGRKADVESVMQWRTNPEPEWGECFTATQCPEEGAVSTVEDDPELPMVACDEDGNKFLLSRSIIEGTQLSDASYGVPQGSTTWAVTLEFKSSARKIFADTTRALYSNGGQFAIVLDNQVISYAGVNEPILDGRAQITGGFNEETASSLATSLKFGALPISFEKDPSTETIGPSLAGNQLDAGLWAGGLGLALVMIYCLIYYRGLGLVVLASLGIAGAITYGMVLLLSEAAGFTLTLPGIAGLIIGVGVTADSFIIFFERIRDEMREGRSMRVAVETGWARARKTRVAANVVSLLSAAVLYFFATGVVKGFGFALGLSTMIDLAVLFWFTKHAVSWLARFRFFNGGGELSGLSASTLGTDAVAQGGRA